MKIHLTSGVVMDIIRNENGDTHVDVIFPPKHYESFEEGLKDEYNMTYEALIALKREGVFSGTSDIPHIVSPPVLRIENTGKPAQKNDGSGKKGQTTKKVKEGTKDKTKNKAKTVLVPRHEDFYTTMAVLIWNAALAHNASVSGALLLVTQAANESGYSDLTHGIAAKYKDYNLFGKTTANKSGASTRPSPYKKLWFKKYASYEESIKDHFKGFTDSGHWPQFADIFTRDTITFDAIDSTLHTGVYSPTKEQENKGILPYNTDTKGGGFKDNANHYGEILMNQDYPGVKKGFIAALKYQIDVNNKEIVQLNSNLKMMVFTNEAVEGFKEKIAQLALDNEKYQKILDAIE